MLEVKPGLNKNIAQLISGSGGSDTLISGSGGSGGSFFFGLIMPFVALNFRNLKSSRLGNPKSSPDFFFLVMIL